MTVAVELNGLAVDCVIGDLPDEREREQRLVVDVALQGDFARSAETDDLADTVDYAALARSIRAALRAAKCRLVERAAAVVAETCFAADGRVERAEVRVAKSGCVEGLASAAVSVAATRQDFKPQTGERNGA